MLVFLAILAVPVAFLSGGVAFNAWRAGDTGMAWKAGTVFALCAAAFIIAPKAVPPYPETECIRYSRFAETC